MVNNFVKMCGLLFCCLALNCTSSGTQLELPNIILCMADDQGWGDMAYYGHPVLQTPHFDAMAQEAMRFDHFYAAAPVCSPTRGSVMTGRHPNRFGCFKWGHSLRPQETTIAEALKSAGYVTGHFGKWHLGSVQTGSPVNPGASGFDEWLSSPNYFDNDPILSREGTAVQMQGESSMVTVDAALEFIRKHSRSDQPFFTVVWFGSPHAPHQASEKDQTIYADQSNALKNFYGEITGMDRAFGKLRAELRTLDIQENTILWYCSDNGGLKDVGTTGGRGYKSKVYEGGLRVPALLEWPAKFKEHCVVDVPCNTSDIYPTLLDIAGVQRENSPLLDGLSLLPLLDGKMKERPEPMGFWNHTEPGIASRSSDVMPALLEAQSRGEIVSNTEYLMMNAGDISKQYSSDSFPGHSAWLNWPWKLHRIESKNKVIFELYNLEADSMEILNMFDNENARITAMQDELNTWLQSVASSLNGKDY